MTSYLTLGAEVLLLAAAFFGFCLGIYFYFKPKKALFPQIITCGLGCLFIGQLFTVIRLLSGYTNTDFHLGLLAPAGFYLFLFSANYGQMDSLLENKLPENRKYAYIAFLSPAVVLMMLAVLWTGPGITGMKIFYSFIFILCAAAAYFNLKHAIFPDVPDGIISSIRGYNIIALLIELVSTLVILSSQFSKPTLRCGLLAAEALLCAAMLPAFRKGSVKWYR